MRQLSPTILAIVLACGLSACGVITAAKKSSPVPDPPAAATMKPDVLEDFQMRVAHYVKFQRNLENETPKQKETAEPIKIELTQTLLAAKIRNTRKNAKQGDIFAPPIAAEFRRLMNPELKGREGREVRQELKEDVGAEGDEGPQKKVPMVVNAKYPEGNALPTVPANILQVLPTLPKDVEYRIIDRNLIMRDVDANIIVDFIPNAIR